MTIDQVRAMLSERLKTALIEATTDYESRRLLLYQHQSSYCQMIRGSPAVVSFSKVIQKRVADLSKDCHIKLTIEDRVETSNYTYMPCPPETEARSRVLIIRQALHFCVVNQTTDCMGRREGGSIGFARYETVPVKGKLRKLIDQWSEDHALCKLAEQRCGKLSGMNVDNESHLLMLKLTEPDNYSALEAAVKELLG